MPPVVRGAITALLTPGFRKVYHEVYEERPLEYPTWCNTPGMEWNPITDKQVGGLSTMPEKPEGMQFDLDEYKLGGTVTYEATPYGLAGEVTFEAFRDEQYGIMRLIPEGLARASRNRKEVQAHSVLNNAFSTSYAGFEATTSLCSTAHVSNIDGVTRSNRPSPDVAFSATALQAMILHFHALTDERNMPMLMSAGMLIIPPAKLFVAREILGTPARPYSAQNEINSLVPEDLKYMVCHYLSSSTAWYALAPKGTHDLNFFIRDDTVTDSFDDPWTKNGVWTIYQRHTQGYGGWRGVYGSSG